MSFRQTRYTAAATRPKSGCGLINIEGFTETA
jgi:hypothetical protein